MRRNSLGSARGRRHPERTARLRGLNMAPRVPVCKKKVKKGQASLKKIFSLNSLEFSFTIVVTISFGRGPKRA
jgi:hypothetical protein